MQGILVFKQHVVHLPKLPLRTSGLGGFGGVFGVGMHVAQWKIAKDEAQSLTQLLLNCLHDGIRFAAVGTFVVAVFNQRDGRVNRPLNVVAPGVRKGQGFRGGAAHFASDLLCNSSNADKMPSAPGFTPTGET